MADPTRTFDPADVAAGVGAPGLGVEEAPPAPGTTDYEVSLKALSQWQLAWRRFRKHRLALVGSVLVGMMVFVAVFGPIIWPYDRLDLYPVRKPGGNPPSAEAIFGTDNLGRSIFELVVNGARISMMVGLGTMAIAVTLGVVIGALSGYFGGLIESLSMRLVDLLLAVPFLFIVIVAAQFFGGGNAVVLMFIFGVLSWPGLARLVRALFLSLREQEYVQAARAVGVGHLRIAFRHILPNALGPIIVSATLIVANAIVLEAFVSFLNFGVKATDVTWGTALSNSQGYLIVGNWWWAFFPGMAIALTVIGINFMGDGLRDAFDPRARA
jgi:ABC-type dipeptide/oligopeptide/nickel transport system permease subunit